MIVEAIIIETLEYEFCVLYKVSVTVNSYFIEPKNQQKIKKNKSLGIIFIVTANTTHCEKLIQTIDFL